MSALQKQNTVSIDRFNLLRNLGRSVSQLVGGGGTNVGVGDHIQSKIKDT